MSLLTDIRNIIARDPAARNMLEVICFYPSFHAMLFYRIGHALWRLRLRFLARWLMQWVRFFTGIEIHPAATIGQRLFIDHAMGVVIGETAQIGDGVTLYHSVTLGGVSPAEASDEQRGAKRHPTLEDGVIVGCGAHILGPVTVGHNAKVGANSVVLRDVAAETTVVGIPAQAIVAPVAIVAPAAIQASTPPPDTADNENRHQPTCRDGAPTREFVPFAVYNASADPVLQAIAQLQQRVCDLESQLASPQTPPPPN